MTKGGRKKVMIVGLGSIGRRHARIFRDELGCEVAAMRSLGSGNGLGVTELRSWKEAGVFSPDVCVITNPTSQHVVTALKCAELGAHLFIEKPLSDGMSGIKQLKEVCRRKRLACYVAYPLRFHPVVLKARELLAKARPLYARAVCASFLPDWRPGRDAKSVYSARRKEGGGVILDLSHEFDYLAYLLGPVRKISGAKGRLADVTVDAEDYADASLVFADGTRASVHLDYFSRTVQRDFHIDLEDGFIRGDLVANTLRCLRDKRERKFSFKVERDDYFVAQARYFLGNISNGQGMNSLAEAVPLLQRILEFRHGRV
ncbi:MAG: Gfo/Idh/MocA family oxidoreductase [Candidatus Omnitrophica bacterium]|nr:Gfo/Idh/MocA family oxidoreductase [Candidatus Omnitrophota bacterium]